MIRLLVVPDEFPLPANTGGRVDIWRRLQALNAFGAELAVLSWFDGGRSGAPSAPSLAQAHAVADEWHLVPITRSTMEVARRVTQVGRLPSHAAARWVTLDRAAVLAWARKFGPDAILLDRLYGVAAVRWLARELGVPWLYRSHNREAEYMGGQLRRATGLKSRLGLMANQAGLAALERAALRDAAAVLDISASDAEHWRASGLTHVHWVPPIADAGFADEVAQVPSAPAWDVLYFGNLNTPNNIEALAWLVNDVLPRVADPGLRVAVAGSRPSGHAQALAARDPRVRLVADPASLAPLVAAARVLVNPMRSGSGVNLKSLDMLCTRARLVSTRVGVTGLPPEAAACFEVHDDAAGFAQAVSAALTAPQLGEAELASRARAREPFEAKAVGSRVLALVGEVVRAAAAGARHG